MIKPRIVWFLKFLLILGSYLRAQDTISDKTFEIAKQLNNPLANMLYSPIQNNTDLGVGIYNGARNTLNLPIIVPVRITPKLSMIARWDQLYITQYDITAENSQQTGFGDAFVRFFFSPANNDGKLAWGAGPAFLVPIASKKELASGKFGVGPTACVLLQRNGWTYGLLANQIWSFAGDDDKPDYNRLYLQPFMAYNWKSGAGLAANIELTQNWEAKTTTAFLNPTISGVSHMGKQFIALSVGPRICVSGSPETKPDFGIRTVLTFVF